MAAALVSKSERDYIKTSLQTASPLRADGRSLLDFRTVLLETGVAPLANGSARLNIGKVAREGGGGTDVLAAVKLEVEDVESGDGVDGGRVACSVTCSPSAYSHLSSNALDELQHDLTVILQQTIAHRSLHPSNLTIIPGRKAWLLNIDAVVLADSGNVVDALFMAARAALWDTKVPRTRPVEYRAPESSRATEKETQDSMDVDQGTSGFDTRDMARDAADFELPDYWDEGEVLHGRERWPICVTLNLLPPIHLLDATLTEEASLPLRLHLMFSFPPSAPPILQAIRLLGPGELDLAYLKSCITDGEKYARELFSALESKLREEDLRRNVKARDRFSALR
ncbi:ribosomal protein S5 domain 2-like protein [Dichomitus squalens LYAD-421 SS1]|uniref:Ribosomal RNA-processing protein 42 n=2 Tax=Dichomitus squalens TaxID=114155 RepID=A0A4Q9MPF8_9APHY|nr:ribosomal protein S5 domain 2-like protein [Dichomitus squalens LYAD-421 SS1]EJF56931.1 ribosomal protein S5 domain 2-like protein [Dichomitus squalens LYAD-421 SS1]TBU28848.1 ribosomal protein S5 domain 2-like protein [Dichomitus squalens]